MAFINVPGAVHYNGARALNLSPGLMTMSVRFLSFVRALRSFLEMLLRIVAGLEVMMSFSTALMKVSRAASLPLGGVHDPLHRKHLTSSDK